MAGSWSSSLTNLIILQEDITGFSGLFGYSPTVGPGNLIFALTAVGGVDPYGNVYQAGFTLTQTQGGTVTASITPDGNAAFQDLTVNGTLFVDGTDLDSLLEQFPLGTVFWGARTTDSDATSGTTEEAVLTLGVTYSDQRMYRLVTSTMRVVGDTAGDVYTIRIRDGGASNPTTSSDQVASAASYVTAASNTATSSVQLETVISCDSTQAISSINYHPGTHNLLLSLTRSVGSGTAVLSTSSGTLNPIELYVEDLGPVVSNTGVPQSGGGGGTPVTSHTTTYTSTWSGSYNGSGGRRTDTSNIYQGFFSSNEGNQKSLVGFNHAQIQSDLTGATVTKTEVYLYYAHWYFNAGGTAVIGTHNLSNTSAPSTFPGSGTTANRVQSSGWTPATGKWVTVSNTIGNELKAGTTKGLMIGPGPSTSQTYYGYANGATQSNSPKIRVTYTK